MYESKRQNYFSGSLWVMYLKQVKDISSIQAIVAEPVQQFHLSARGQVLEGPLSEWVGFPLFQFPPVADDVVQVTAKSLGAIEQSRNNRRDWQEVRTAHALLLKTEKKTKNKNVTFNNRKTFPTSGLKWTVCTDELFSHPLYYGTFTTKDITKTVCSLHAMTNTILIEEAVCNILVVDVPFVWYTLLLLFLR